MPYRVPPMTFARSFDVTLPVEQRKRHFDDIMRMNPCCVDADATGKLQRRGATFNDASLCRGMQCLFLTMPFTGMNMERNLAQIRRACNGQTSNPTIEKICTSGFMAPMLTEHLKMGRSDPRVTTKEQLEKAQVPIRANRKKVRAEASKPAGSFLRGVHLIFPSKL